MRRGKGGGSLEEGRRGGGGQDAHMNNSTCFHRLEQLLWPGGEVGGNCMQVVMATEQEAVQLIVGY